MKNGDGNIFMLCTFSGQLASLVWFSFRIFLPLLGASVISNSMLFTVFRLGSFTGICVHFDSVVLTVLFVL